MTPDQAETPATATERTLHGDTAPEAHTLQLLRDDMPYWKAQLIAIAITGCILICGVLAFGLVVAR